MLSKGLIKLVNSLDKKKFRQEHNLFVAEGYKLVNDLIRLGAPIKSIISSINIENTVPDVELYSISQADMEKISFMKTVPEIIALVEIVDHDFIYQSLENELSIGLDSVQDPGNMGTIIRLANWFGIKNILCSRDSADIYNPKVVQSSMGAILGVKVHYLDLPSVICELVKFRDYRIYGTFMQGPSIYNSDLHCNGLLVMGNEGKGISHQVESFVTNRISIPTFTERFNGVESLNVGVAAGIIISEFVRRYK